LAAVERSQHQIATLVEAKPEDIVFTSGATEANNLALRGLEDGWGSGRPRFLVSSIEHASILELASVFTGNGRDFVVLRVLADGTIDLDHLEAELALGPSVVSIGAANGEIGTIQPIRQIADLCRKFDSVFHTDATQAAGRVPMNSYGDYVDLITISSHKIYGPKGIGALVVAPQIKRHLKPLLIGGGQQQGLRAGTIPTPLCVGFGVACELAAAELRLESERLTCYQVLLLEELKKRSSAIEVNGPIEKRLPGNLSIRIQGVNGTQLATRLRDIAISTGSACASSGTKASPSHVLKALGLSDAVARSSVRISFGRFSTAQDYLIAAQDLDIAIKFATES
jgi:cysteine desulfurase